MAQRCLCSAKTGRKHLCLVVCVNMIPFYCFNNMAIGIVLCCYLYGAHFFQHLTRAYENLALGKSAWQLNPYSIGYEYSANRAVDGRKSNLSEFGGECTSSSIYKTTAMWWVDLGTQQSIHHILIQYATGNRVWGEENSHSPFFLGFSVYISPTTNKDDGVLCFRDTYYTRATIPNPVNITCYYHGRYVIYYNNRTNKPFPNGYSEYAYNDLCEVEVYGCRNSGQYGTVCSFPCPQNCLLGRCHIKSGECAECVAGYKGKSCSEECDNNMYGRECSQACGNCSKGEQCHHVNGSCINGCDVGLFGDECDKDSRVVMNIRQEAGEESMGVIHVKCTQCWPESINARLHGDFVIKNVEEKEYAFYVIRKLSMSPKEVTRSAGIGRTGTYIALDALYKAGKTTGKINMAEYVKVMRSNRMNMVQTYEQYMVIFLALNEKLKAYIKPESLSDFTENVESLIGDVPANQTVIRKQFEKLLQIRPEYSRDDYKNAIPHASNPNDTVLPLDKYCLYLTSSGGNRGCYINAISVSSFIKINAFIVTQYPPPEDAVDFLRLLTDHESDTVICLNPLQEIKSTKSWLPSRESSKSVVPFTVQYESESDTNVKTTNIKILNEENESHHIVVIEPKGPLRSEKAVQDTAFLRNLVSYALNISTEPSITILSKDGASLCGVFCAVFNCIQQINMDNSVDVFTTVRQLQTQRPEFCSTEVHRYEDDIRDK